MDRPPEIPLAFWESMSAEQHGILAPLLDAGLMLFPTGSRIICPAHARPDSDWDFYCYLSLYHDRPPFDESWKQATSANKTGGYSFTKGGINIVAFADEVELQKFHDATQFCISIGGPTTREKRVAVFESIRRIRPPTYFEPASWEEAAKAGLFGFPSGLPRTTRPGRARKRP